MRFGNAVREMSVASETPKSDIGGQFTACNKHVMKVQSTALLSAVQPLLCSINWHFEATGEGCQSQGLGYDSIAKYRCRYGKVDERGWEACPRRGGSRLGGDPVSDGRMKYINVYRDL